MYRNCQQKDVINHEIFNGMTAVVSSCMFCKSCSSYNPANHGSDVLNYSGRVELLFDIIFHQCRSGERHSQIKIIMYGQNHVFALYIYSNDRIIIRADTRICPYIKSICIYSAAMF